MSNNLYCPKWVFDICVAATAESFISDDIPIDVSSKKFVRGLNKHYSEVKLLEIKYGAESIIKFMGLIKKPQFNSYERLRQFLFYTLKYEKKFFISKRKFNTLIGSQFTGTKKKEYSEDLTLRDFKKFIFSLRANLVERAPKSWDIKSENEEELDFLGPLLMKKHDFE